MASANIPNPVFSLDGDKVYSGDRGDYTQTDHSYALELSNGTVALTFNADSVQGMRALFSKDGSGFEDGGHLSTYIQNGKLIVRQQTDATSEHLRVPDVTIEEGQTYHLAVSFGEDGLNIYLNGALVASEPEFKQGLEANDRAFVVGASGKYRTDDSQTAAAQFDGTISDVMVFDTQMDRPQMADLAGAVDPAFATAAYAAMEASSLIPAFEQLHHGSDEAKALAMAYGINHDGELTTDAAYLGGTDGDDTLSGSGEADAIDGGLSNDVITGEGGNDVLQGGYGNDDLDGGDGNDVLDGGHGEDVLNGGAGDDLLISRSDGREGEIAYDPDRDEGDPENELTDGKLYPDQPIPADDVMTGGSGADVFYFQTLINAKERYIEKHTRDDGTINWHGVAGENDKLHDHWVDTIGNDVITDFTRDDGDRIVIEGHTTKIKSIVYGDSNNDGVMDHTVITLYSDQGNGGGAHNQDELGTITVYGDLVQLSDISTTAKPAYGIVKSIGELDEALKPIQVSEDTGDNVPLPDLPTADDLPLPEGMAPVFALAGPAEFSGERGDYIQAGHSDALELSNGTVALTFNADSVQGMRALFSKDGSGFEDGGHLSTYIQNGKLIVRQQTDATSEHLRVPDVTIEEGQTYHLAVSFGEDGLNIYLNGALVASEPEFKQGLEANDRAFVVGASGKYRTDDSQTAAAQFDGTISDVMVFDSQMDRSQMADLAGAVDPAFATAAYAAMEASSLIPAFEQLHHGSDEAKALAMAYGINHDGELTTDAAYLGGTDGDDTLSGSGEADAIDGGLSNDVITGEGGNDVLQGGYGNDDLDGGDGNDVLDGGHGEDVLNGGAGDDLLISRSDGREGEIAYDPDRDEGDPENELTDGKLYPDQPIPADDVMTGGSGADVFYIQTLINAKERYIEKHTRDDGTINWHGVAGENDKLHDHWVDTIGNDVITDFSLDEGDRIVIEGHTTKIKSLVYGDADNDGVLDHTLLTLYSDQGNGGGAHNQDELGTLTVYGDLVKLSDISTTAKPAYGIVKSIGELDEALKPIQVSEDTGAIAPPPDLPTANDLPLPEGSTPVLTLAGPVEFSGEKGAEFAFEHTESMEMSEGTIAFSFKADTITGYDALFSKDASGYGDGGHLTAFVTEAGDVKVRFQTEEESHWLLAENVASVGEEVHVAFTFGDEGAFLFINGQQYAENRDVSADWLNNKEYLLVGANGWASRPGEAAWSGYGFDGEITDFTVIDEQLDNADILLLADDHAII